MDSIQFENLKDHINKYLIVSLNEKRYQHTVNVAQLAKEMAIEYGVDLQKAETAALLHDMARNIPITIMNTYVEKMGLSDRYKDNVNLAHSKIGRALAEIEFNITDTDVLNAISYHTTGRKDMSLLEKIIFLADAIEPKRSYHGIEELRKQAKININKACLMSLLGTIDFIKKQGKYVDQDTIEAAEYFKRMEEE